MRMAADFQENIWLSAQEHAGNNAQTRL